MLSFRKLVLLLFLVFIFLGWTGKTTPPSYVVLPRHPESLDEDIPNAVFTHFFHEGRFQCFVCHPSGFQKNLMTHDDFDEGKFCGTCHQGKIAFPHDSDEYCDVCHR